MKNIINKLLGSFEGLLLIDGEIKYISLKAKIRFLAWLETRKLQEKINSSWACGEYGHYDDRPRYIGVVRK